MYGGAKLLEAVGMRAQHVVEHEHVVVAELLRRLRVVADDERVVADLCLREHDAEFHEASLQCA